MATSSSALKILVIDDSNTVRQSAEMFLRQGGHEVFLAEDGFDALSKVSDHQPDMIFCDILMPRLDGYQTCAIIKRNPNFENIPIVMLSALGLMSCDQRPCTESNSNRCAAVSVPPAVSLMCTNSMSGQPQAARSARRPIRPKPLMPMRVLTLGLLEWARISTFKYPNVPETASARDPPAPDE